MKLSVIIVNYNVKYFLEQCLHSVFDAIKEVDAEVFVVDNHSVDGSVKMVEELFAQVKLIANKENFGFSKANNQAIKQAKGEYILLLNPDTIVESDTFTKTLAFMDQTPDAGALGVKMVNGKGEFLPESKRSLPLPSVAFYKIFGLSKIFKKSKRFGKYHLTYLNKDEIHKVDVLSGAFMLLRKSVLDKIGYLDEDFFMYGEDIDLSYRITKAGYENYYYPKTCIIHYKGESTKKSSINYVFVFYRAMQIFAKKHFSKKNAKTFSFFINAAIWMRASLSIVKRLLLKICVPFLDIILGYFGLFFIASYWEQLVLVPRGSGFPDAYLFIILPIYTLIWILAIFFSGGYKKPVSIEKVNKGVLFGTIFILIIYALLDEELRFSRAIIILGTLWMLVATNALRYLIKKIPFIHYPIGDRKEKRVLIVGDANETKRVATLLSTMPMKNEFVGFVNHTNEDSKDFVGNISQLKDIVLIYKINELIFCGKNMSSKDIISIMTDMHDSALEYKIAPPKSLYIIGSNSINVSGDIYTMKINSVGKKENMLKKSIFDKVMAFLLLLMLPFCVWFVKQKGMFIKNIFLVLFGKKTWVGYNLLSNGNEKLPVLKKGVLFTTDAIVLEQFDSEIIQQVNNLYANDYKVSTDLNILIKGFKHLGRDEK